MTENDEIAREAAKALYEGENHARALWRIISRVDQDLYELLRNYRFADQTELKSEIEERIESLEQPNQQ